ncbi:MAG: hypothetical protein IPP71_20040 [Bacteroidetes bacterium]|nr:hypothetical protein [Bacteroidota bacterium]
MIKTPFFSSKIWIAVLFFGFSIFLTFNRHSKSGVQNYHSEIWADKAGYYIYLPALFIVNFDGHNLPLNIDKKTGNGFSVEDGIIKTKYTLGVALMQSPFFLAGHFLAKLMGYESNGFSLFYHKMINIAAVCYTFLAFIFLYLFLIRYLSPGVALVSLSSLYLGTNIFYYSIFETGMSHIYSFFLFACFIYLSPFVTRQHQKKSFYLLFGVIIGLIIVVRPINVMFLPVYFIFNSIKFYDTKTALTNFLLVAAAAILVVLPQLFYWNYAFGNYFHYSYGQEGFSNWFAPKLVQLWFSTNNGWLVYNPMVFLILAGCVILYKQHPQKSIGFTIYLLLISLVFASWHDWSYGCSYGCRPYVEYYVIMALPLGFFIEKLSSKFTFRVLLIAMLVIFIGYNQKLMFSYDGCWYGGTWDSSELLRLVLSATK